MQFSWKNPLKALPVLLVLAAYAGAAFGAAGNVQFVIGDAKLLRAGVTRALQKGDEINEGDRVITAANASAQIKMVDGGFIAIRPNTNMGFDTYRYSGKEDGSESAIVSLLRGGFRTITGIIGRSNKQNYLIKTATATIGIRGTDHEPMVILPPAPGQAPIAEAGTYDKVNLGVAFIRTDAGSVDIQRNQVGFASVTKAAPVILPKIPPFYQPTPAPGPQKATEEKKEEGRTETAAATAEIRDTAVVDSASSVATGGTESAAAAAPAVTQPVVAITATDASGTILNTTTQTATSSAGVQTPIGSTTPTTPTTPTPTTQALPAGNYLAAVMFPVATTGGFNEGFSPDNPLQASTTYQLDGSGNLINAANMQFQVQSNQNGIVLTPVITSTSGASIKWSGGTAADTLKLTDSSIFAGRWVDSTITVTDNSAPTSVFTYTPTNSLWAVLLPPPAGFVQSLTGTTTYTLAGHTTPVDAFGNLGTLNSASLAANFTAQTVDAAVNLTMSAGSMAGTFDLSATAMPIEVVTSINPSGFGVPNSSALTTTCTGACAAGTSGYSADIGGSFAGASAASAGLSYNIWPTTTTSAPATNSVQGLVAFTAAGAPAVPSTGLFAAYAPNNIAIEVATPFFGFEKNSLVAPADAIFAGGGLSSFTTSDIGGGGGSNTFSVIGGSGPVTANATNFAATGVQFGRWSSATALQATFTNPLGAQSGAPATWIYGPQGYLDTPVVAGVNTGPLTGTFSYALDGSTAPHDRQSGTSGTLTSAAISANFTSQTASASLALTVGGQAWSAATSTPVPIFDSQFSANSSPGGVGNNLTVQMGAGTPAACPTCFGNLNGAFTGQNYAGAILSYQLWDNSDAGGDIVGHAALTRTGPTVTNSTPNPTGKYFVADFGGNIQPVDTLSTPGGVLTSFGSGGSALPGTNPSSSTTVNCTTCTVTAATNATTSAAPTGVFFGTWDTGTYTNTFSLPISSTSSFGGSPHWITGPEAGPLFLPNALTGTKTFSFDGGMVTNSAGVAGTVQNTTALTVDFTRQVAGINIDLSINDTASTPALHTWNAKTLAGNEAAINSGNGIGGAAFHASTDSGGRGLLTVTVDGATPANAFGNVSGQLTGTGLNGAIMSYDFSAVLGASFATFEQVNGVVALTGPVSDVTTAHRAVMISATDPFSLIPQPMLGYYVNNPTRMLADATGNLTRFDMNEIDNNNGSDNPSHSLSSGTSTLADFGSDPVSGISWGRWAGGSINGTNRIDGTIETIASAGSLHWIAGPTETAAVTLPISGTFSYVRAGNTLPTDNLGNVGVLNSATLNANFTALTVDVGVQATIAGATLGGSASAVPIIQRTAFAAGPDMPVNLAVSCTGTCGTTHRGTVVGGFTGAGATGAAMMYSLEKIGANASVTSGVVAFHR